MEQINLSTLPLGEIPQIVHCSQGDVGRNFKLALKDETGAAFNLDGTETLQFTGYKPDGNIFIYELPSQSGSVIEISTQEQMTARHGDVICEVRIKKNGSDIGTCNFVLQVECSPAESGKLSESALEAIEIIISQAENYALDAASSATAAEASKNDCLNIKADCEVISKIQLTLKMSSL